MRCLVSFASEAQWVTESQTITVNGVKNSIQVFQHESLTSFFVALVDEKSRARGFSQARWAKQLGYRSPRTVGMVIQGKRLPTLGFIQSVCRVEKYTPQESQYLTLLLEREKRARHHLSCHDVSQELAMLRKGKCLGAVKDLSPDRYGLISGWKDQVIWALIGVHDFPKNALFVDQVNWLNRNIGIKQTNQDTCASLERLVAAGLIEIVEDSIRVCSPEQISTQNNLPSATLRKHHREMLELAKTAIETQLIGERVVLGRIFILRKSDFERASRELLEFMNQFMSKYGSDKIETGDAVYDFHAALFRLTGEI